MKTELVLVYATGYDMELRRAAWDLLEKGQLVDADLLDQSSLYIKEGGFLGGGPKTSAVGRAVMLVAKREHQDAVIARLKQIGEDGEVRAYVLPVERVI